MYCRITRKRSKYQEIQGYVISFNFVMFMVVIKLKFSRYRPGVAQRVGGGMALLFHDRSTRRGVIMVVIVLKMLLLFKTSLSDSSDSSTDVLGELASFQTSVHIYENVGLTYQKIIRSLSQMIVVYPQENGLKQINGVITNVMSVMVKNRKY